jgi:hypothetical protein
MKQQHTSQPLPMGKKKSSCGCAIYRVLRNFLKHRHGNPEFIVLHTNCLQKTLFQSFYLVLSSKQSLDQ